MVCPFAIAVRVGLAVFVLKAVYDAVCIYQKKHSGAPADDSAAAKKEDAQPKSVEGAPAAAAAATTSGKA